MVTALIILFCGVLGLRPYKPLSWFIVLVPAILLRKYEVKRKIEQRIGMVEQKIRKGMKEREERMKEEKMMKEIIKEMLRERMNEKQEKQQ